MHILRGTGLNGASGMRFVRDNYYVRPFLDTPKAEVMQYVYENQIPYVDDETNHTTVFSRNLIRNKVFPDLRLVWPNVEQALAEFGAICRQDDDYINTMVDLGGMVVKDNLVKLPLTYFIYNASIISRVLYNAFAKLGVTSDIERKHIQMLVSLAKNGMNGAKLDLPHECRAFKEYEYLTIARAKPKMTIDTEWPFKLGVTNIAEFGKIKIKKSKDHLKKLGMLLIDLDKIPDGAVWRMRREGDFIQKFGGGTKTLKAYLVDKKIPQRIRDLTPVLAYGNDILIVAGVDISDKLKVGPSSKNVADVQYISQN
ncbi:MAG: tRNA lysidine(34) synthetase TilS [Clostridia bacterium]|nr:tRNA lysidine(34) synthetase TilS [Clostridia bacterium]